MCIKLNEREENSVELSECRDEEFQGWREFEKAGFLNFEEGGDFLTRNH
jgi:hypothetical protein